MADVTQLLIDMNNADAMIKSTKQKLLVLGVANGNDVSIPAILSDMKLKANSADQGALQPLVRLPWDIMQGHMLQPSAANQSGHILSTTAALRALLTALRNVDGFVGGVGQLFGAELNDANICLMASIPSHMRHLLVARSCAAQSTIENIMLGHQDIVGILDIRILNLSACSLEQFWGWRDITKPQQPLQFESLLNMYHVTGLLQMSEPHKDGFVGMAVNMLFMPDTAYNIWFRVNGVLTAASLRQTVAYILLGQRMVFSSDQHLHAFTSRCQTAGVLIHQPLISLQGATYNLVDVGIHANSQPYRGPLLFPGVPTQLRVDSPLDIRTVARKVRHNLHIAKLVEMCCCIFFCKPLAILFFALCQHSDQSLF